MTGLRPRKPSASMIVALIALMVALGGTSYAAFSLPKNSVGSKQLKKNAVTAAKLHNGAVTTAKIKNGAVTAAKINPAGLTVPNATSATSATNASNLGGNPASDFERASNILTAVVTNNGSASTVVRGTPGTTAQRIFTGQTLVTFPRDVSGCTWIATQGNPGDTSVPGAWATVRGNGSPDVVYVITYNSSGYVDDNFHLAVLC